MNKYIYFFLFTFTLNASEPIIAKLVKVDSNAVQKFSISNYTFYCRPYGILNLDELHNNSSLKSKCRQKIKSYYSKHPRELYFAQTLFKRGQGYHIEFKEKSCVVYAQGQYTYSELLLRQGLAVRKRNFTDPEFKASFYKAQKIAIMREKGIWKDEVIKNCVAEMYK